MVVGSMDRDKRKDSPMRWIVLLIALWCAPLGLANEDTEEAGWRSRPKVVIGCPGGKCKVARPWPRPSR